MFTVKAQETTSQLCSAVNYLTYNVSVKGKETTTQPYPATFFSNIITAAVIQEIDCLALLQIVSHNA